ncbi:MAG: HEAT repeat domain-containing protein [Planctomycetota bacterium]
MSTHPARRRAWSHLGPWALLLAALAQPVRADSLSGLKRLLDDPDPAARAAAVRRLAGNDEAVAHRLVLDVLGDEHPYVRRAAAGVLAGILERRELVARALPKLGEARARAAAAEGVALWLDDAAGSVLLKLLDDKSPDVRVAALEALLGPLVDGAAPAALPAAWREATVVDRLDRALADRDGLVRAVALGLLLAWRPGQATEARLADLLGDPDPRVRLAALEGSAAMSTEAAAVAVLRGSDDAVWSVRLVAAELSGAVRTTRVLDRLITWLETEPRERVVAAIQGSLVQLVGIPFEGEQWKTWRQGEGASFEPAPRDGETPPAVAPGTRVAPGTHTVETGRFLGLPLVSTHVAFVVDASGSMREVGRDGRRRDERAREALDEALKGLQQAARPAEVNVHRFHDGVESFERHGVVVSDAMRRRVATWLAAREPAGRTALFDGIAAALSDPDVDQIVVLSDGAPSAGSWFTKTDLLREVMRLQRWTRARVDVVRIGQDGVAARWRNLLDQLATATGGVSIAR